MIQPTVGRKVWFIRNNDQEQPEDATVCHVNDDGTVNLACHDELARPFAALNVPLLQEEDLQDYDAPRVYPFARWMPYQIGQAKKSQEPAATPALAELAHPAIEPAVPESSEQSGRQHHETADDASSITV